MKTILIILLFLFSSQLMSRDSRINSSTPETKCFWINKVKNSADPKKTSLELVEWNKPEIKYKHQEGAGTISRAFELGAFIRLFKKIHLGKDNTTLVKISGNFFTGSDGNNYIGTKKLHKVLHARHAERAAEETCTI